MTDKVQLIKEEIEKRIELLEPLECEYNKGSIDAYKGILRFINSLPEESKKQPKFKVGDTIKGPYNNIFQVKEVLDKQYVLHSENGDELNSIEIVDKYSCISEEPTDETIKGDYNERYKRIVQTEQFKQSYCNKSLGKEESTDEANCTTKNQDLDEELRKILNKYYYFPDEDDELRSTPELAKYIAYHFAEWQIQKNQETIELAEDHAMLAGMMKEREEMMKDAVDATIVNDWQYGKDPDHAVIPAIHQRIDGFNVGDKVKIIIVKEE